MMSFDDFSMYFRDTFVESARGTLCYIEGVSPDSVLLREYTSPDTSEHKSIPLSEAETYLHLRAFPLKPFCYNGSVYSPSFRSVRGYKDGVNANRIDFNNVSRNNQVESLTNQAIIAMFFTKNVGISQGIQAIVSGEYTHSSLEDDFLLVKKAEDKSKDPEPLQNVRGYMDDQGRLTIEDGINSYICRESTRIVNINPDLPGKVIALFDRIRKHTGWPEGKVPMILQNDYLRWLARNSTEKPPRVELYRHGFLICDILEEPHEVMKGLPRLSAFLEDLKNEYICQTTGA